VSYRLYPLAWAASVSTTAKIVLLKLVDHASDDGTNVRPGVKAICSACGLREVCARVFALRRHHCQSRRS